MPKGGYRIFDFKEVNFVSTETHIIPGIYSVVEGLNGKPLMISGLKINGIEVSSFWLNFRPISGKYNALFNIDAAAQATRMIVDSQDNVNITNVNTAGSVGDPGVSDEDGPSASV